MATAWIVRYCTRQNPSNTNNAWNVRFSDGNKNNNNKNNNNWARVVRMTSALHANFTTAELVQAWVDCRRRKRKTKPSLEFEMGLPGKIMALSKDLRSCSYTPGPSYCFVVTRPKIREVWAADFRDRVVHHFLWNRIGPGLVKSFAEDSCACIPGRGTLYGALRLEKKIRRISENWSKRVFYLKCDIASFFNSICKSILDAQLSRRIADPWWLWLARTILHHDPRPQAIIKSPPELMAQVPEHKSLLRQNKGRGLAIGDLSSQFCANVHMDDLDQFVLHHIRPFGYVRYVDDFILLARETSFLSDALVKIKKFLWERLRLVLNDSKTILQPVDRGVDFVGHIILPWRKVIRKRVVHNAYKTMINEIRPTKRRDRVNSYLGLLRQGNNFKERARLLRIARALGHAHDFCGEKVYA